jgi:putative oxidoreductase
LLFESLFTTLTESGRALVFVFVSGITTGKEEPMKTLYKIYHWSDEHHFILLDFLRICLGTILLIKGIQFGQNQNDIEVIADNGPFNFMSLILVQYIVMAHIAGGFLILIGLITRTAILFQLPILIGAVIFTPAGSGMAFYQTELLAILVLALLITILVYGSGSFSADRYLRRHPNG